jgi:peptide chain release factor 3
LGAVGALQFDVIANRLKGEYCVVAHYENLDYTISRWVSTEDKKHLAAFEKANRSNLALDSEGNLTYLAVSQWKLERVAEEWPRIDFLKTRDQQ